jgi:hypothetical protein
MMTRLTDLPPAQAKRLADRNPLQRALRGRKSPAKAREFEEYRLKLW